MALKPDDIQNKSFNIRMRGFDQNQVKEHLNKMKTEFDRIEKKNEDLESQLNRTNDKLNEYQDKHDSLNRSIITAQDAADRVKEEADAEANEIISNAQNDAKNIREEAEENSDRLLKDAVEKARKIENETEELRKQTNIFRKKLRTMLQTQLDGLNDENWDKILNFESINNVNTDTIDNIEKGLNYENTKTHAEISTEAQNDETDNSGDGFGETPAIEVPDVSK